MSIRELSQLASRRDLVGKDEEAPMSTHPESGATQFADALIAQIPTEIVAAYTALVAVVVAVIPSNDSYLALRIGILVAAVLLAAMFVIVGYLTTGACATEPETARIRKDKRHLPVLEASSAAIAAAAWGLAMPGSPLSAMQNQGLFAITSACIVIGGATVLGLFAPLLKRGNGATSVVPPRDPPRSTPRRPHQRQTTSQPPLTHTTVDLTSASPTRTRSKGAVR